MAMRQANLDLFIHPVKKACTEVDREASLYKCNLCHKTFLCPQGLGGHMAAAHREKDKAAGGIRAPKFGSAKPMAPEVAATHEAAFKNFTDEQQRSTKYWGKPVGPGKQAENILEMVATAVALEKEHGKEHGTLTVIVNGDGSSTEVILLDDDVSEGEVAEGEEEPEEQQDGFLPMQSRLTLKQKIAIFDYYHANGEKIKPTCRWIIATFKRSSVSRSVLYCSGLPHCSIPSTKILHHWLTFVFVFF